MGVTEKVVQAVSRAPMIALLGNPNCGKTALFNRLTGARQKVANYAGVTIDRKDSYDQDDMKVVRDIDSGRLRAIGKRLAKGVNAESIGLLAFRGEGGARFADAIEREMRTPEGTTVWYLRVIHYLAQHSEVWTLDISGDEWGEVDFPEDVERAEALVKRAATTTTACSVTRVATR